MPNIKTSASAMPSYGYEEVSAFPAQSIHRCIPLTKPGNQIRVLELHPVQSSTPANTSALHGSVHLLNLPPDPLYSALSYVWAQEDQGYLKRPNRLVIHCANHEHEARIGPNCWSALWHIRKTKQPLRIWVDSICIDQRNEEEKVRQLSLMRIIYTMAFRTYIWLGEAGKGTDEAMNFLSKSSQLTSTSGSGAVVRAVEKSFLHILILLSRSTQAGLVEILRRPWITRLWTLQECLLSTNGIVICEKKSLPFKDFAYALQDLHLFRLGPWSINLDNSHTPWLNLANLIQWYTAGIKEKYADPRRDQPLERDIVEIEKVQEDLSTFTLALDRVVLFICILPGILDLFKLILSEGRWTGRLTLSAFALLGDFVARYPNIKLLRRFDQTTKMPKQFDQITPMAHHPIVEELRSRKASDKKDLFWGIVGILDEDTLRGTRSLSINILYRKLCTSLIERTRSLEILLLADADNSELETQPSWVIDWRWKGPQVLGKAIYYHETSGIGRYVTSRLSLLPILDVFRELPISASRSVPFKFRGAMPGTKPMWEFRQHDKRLCIYGIFLTSVSSHFAPRKTDITGIGPRSLNSVLCAAISDMSEYEQCYVNNLVAVLTLKEYGTVEASLRNWWNILHESPNRTEGIEWFEEMLSKDNGLREGHHLLINTLMEENLSVVRCESAAMWPGGMAFSGTSVLVGDAVFLVSGLSFPLVLRPCGSRRFKLVGPIFVPGIMHGELQEMVKMIPLDEMVLV